MSETTAISPDELCGRCEHVAFHHDENGNCGRCSCKQFLYLTDSSAESPSGQAWREWFERVGQVATTDVVNATATLVIAEQQAAELRGAERMRERCGERVLQFGREARVVDIATALAALPLETEE